MLDPDVRKWYSKEAQTYLAEHSDDMDKRGRYLSSVGIHIMGQMMTRWRGKGMYTQELTEKQKRKMTPSQIAEYNKRMVKQYEDLIGYARNQGEAPNHAEAGLYKTDSTDINIARYNSYVELAAQAWKTNNPNQAMYLLSLALHTAQDRGAHGDGKPGLGHDPRRMIKPPKDPALSQHYKYYQEGWKGEHCDNINKNPDGFYLALGGSLKVLTKFVAEIGVTPGEKEVSEKTMQKGAGLAAWKQPNWFKRQARGVARWLGGKDVIRP